MDFFLYLILSLLIQQHFIYSNSILLGFLMLIFLKELNKQYPYVL